MIILINSEYRIDSDEHQWIIQQLPRQMKDGRRNPRWRNIGYFKELDTALAWLAQRRIRLMPGTWEGVEALPVLCEALDSLRAETKAALASVPLDQVTIG